MSNLPNSVIRLVPPTLRGGYCPDSWQEFANELVCGTQAQHSGARGTTFYNFGNTAPYPPAPTPEPPTPACLDFGIDWEPAAFAAEEYVSFFLKDPYPGLNGATKLLFEADRYRQEPTLDVWFIRDATTLEEIEFPNCTQFDNYLNVVTCPVLTAIRFPVLTTQVGGIGGVNKALLRFVQNPNLVTVELPNLANSSRLSIWGNTSLTTLSMPNLVPQPNGDFYFDGNALNVASVNEILARFAASSWQNGTLDLSGGTNAAPTGQGIIDKATIAARPSTSVLTN